MRKLMLSLVALVVAAGATDRALAVPQFQKEFLKKYVDEHESKEFQELVKKKAKCCVCHQGLKDKHNMNAYGVELGKLLDRKKDAKDVEKIVATLEKVGKMRSNPKDEKSPTYAELIAAGKLPGGALEDLLKEPEKKDGEKAE
ncbi:MAG: hypothetical protein KF688_16365 [Pirellulales bacterium]|nr:hypothetical protein [Pirellulales bacterium]